MSSWIERCAERALRMAGYIVQPGESGDVLLFGSDGVRLAVASRRLLDGKWNVRRPGGWLLVGRPPRLVTESPCFGFVALLGLNVDGSGST